MRTSGRTKTFRDDRQIDLFAGMLGSASEEAEVSVAPGSAPAVQSATKPAHSLPIRRARPRSNSTASIVHETPRIASADCERTGKTNALAQISDILENPRNRLSVRPKPRVTLTKPTHTVAVADLPAYDEEQRAIAEAALGAIPVDRVMLTYADITAWFGISRATIVRKVRAGLVPGIRFLHERVLEDGPVRRFTREQVRYLLLAVRCRMATE